MSEPYTPTESALIAASIGTGPFLSAREAQESIARIKAEAWWEGWLNGALDECCAVRTPAECTSNPYEQDGEAS